MRPVYRILPVPGGYLVAWQDLSGAYGEFTTDEPLRLWYQMYKDYLARRSGRLYLLRLLNPDDTQDVVPVTKSQHELRTEEMRQI